MIKEESVSINVKITPTVAQDKFAKKDNVSLLQLAELSPTQYTIQIIV